LWMIPAAMVSLRFFSRPGLPLGLAHAIQGGAETEVVKAAQFRIQIAFVRHYADQMLGGPRVFHTVDAVDMDGPGIRSSQTGEDVDGRRLAGTVGAEKAEKFAGINVESDLRDRLHLIKLFGKPSHFDGYLVGILHSRLLFPGWATEYSTFMLWYTDSNNTNIELRQQLAKTSPLSIRDAVNYNSVVKLKIIAAGESLSKRPG